MTKIDNKLIPLGDLLSVSDVHEFFENLISDIREDDVALGDLLFKVAVSKAILEKALEQYPGRI